ncbi:unnamed protein product [Rotaria magnacalcarata]|uniref:BTB domain-containing protein n=1 Tax=Rotaria magnacalcarata TaxID=392030 RepID=A0A818XG64_9BILA|nr:unnamed protein product [Rotaria magnacalcarata]CAF2051213.1 unnamed protein product [Rotaria magnacalcarata]CAF3737020.1 unnamed protein product [Rotaria magnacalcarata]CAF3784632.1 unnamed protein product [Rotaria magnacalcarata]
MVSSSTSSSIPELLRLSSILPSPLDYFTDSSKILKSDIILVVEKDKFYCHRLLLSLVSPVFSRMFDGEFKEHDAHEIVLEGKTSESILELLKYIYPQFHGKITNDNVEDFLLLADEYMIDYLKQPCRDFLMKQLQPFKFVSLPTQTKIEQPSMKLKSFHASESALDSSQHQDIESLIRHNHNATSVSSLRQLTSNTRRHTAKSTSNYSKSNDRTGSSSNNNSHHHRYVLFLDKTRLPNFFDAHNTSISFTTIDVELWLRRLRILYRIDKTHYYGEVIDYILSILQFIPAIALFTFMHTTLDTCSIDGIILNDIARARMYILEEWATDGDPYRIVSLTDSYRTLSPSIFATNDQQQLLTNSTNLINDEENSFRETILIATALEATHLGS